MTKLLLIVLLIVLSAYGFGLELQARFSTQKKSLALPLGMAVLFFSLQLFFYPIQYFNLNSLWIDGISSIVLVLGLGLTFKNRKALIHQVKHIPFLWLLAYGLVFGYVLYHSSISMPFSDSQMYLNYIAQNSSIDHLNTFNLWTGKLGQEFDTIYLFQGYYHFAGFLNLAVNSLYRYVSIGHEISVIVTSVYGLGLLYALTYGLSIVNFIDTIDVKSKLTKIVLYGLALFYFGFYYYRVVFAFYGNTWRTLFITLLVFELYHYSHHRDKAHLIFGCLFLGAAISTSSSSLFIGFAVLYGFAAYAFSQKMPQVLEKLGFLISPIVLYALVMFSHDHNALFYPLLAITILFYGFVLVPQAQPILRVLNRWLSKLAIPIFVILIPTFAMIMAYLIVKENPNYLYGFQHFFQNHSDYDMVQDYLFLYSDQTNIIMNGLRYGGLIVLISTARKHTQNRYLLWTFLAVTLLFLNPFATAFVSKTMASNVYYRAYDAIFNPFTELVYVAFVFDALAQKRTLQFLLIGIVVYAVGRYHYGSLVQSSSYSGYGFYIDEGKTVMPYEKIPYREYATIQAFKERISSETAKTDQWTVISHADGLRTYVPQAYQLFTARQYWYEWDRVDEVFYYAARRYYSWETKLYPTTFATGCMYLQQFKVDYALIDTLDNSEFYAEALRCSDEVFSEDGFSLLKVR